MLIRNKLLKKILDLLNACDRAYVPSYSIDESNKVIDFNHEVMHVRKKHSSEYIMIIKVYPIHEKPPIDYP